MITVHNPLSRVIRIIKRIWVMRWMFRSLPKTIYFNFHYLKFKEAIKLPILLYKPKLLAMKGSVVINDTIKFGMIQLGPYSSVMHPNSGFVWENCGGDVMFRGRCKIGNSSCLSIGRKGRLIIGNDFVNASGAKILCFRSVTLGAHIRFGWGVTVMDTNFHPLIDKETDTIKPASGPITIGDYNWLGTEVLVMHSVKTPERCIFGARTIINRSAEMESFAVSIASSKVKIVTRGVYRDICGPNDFDSEI